MTEGMDTRGHGAGSLEAELERASARIAELEEALRACRVGMIRWAHDRGWAHDEHALHPSAVDAFDLASRLLGLPASEPDEPA